MSMCSLNTLIYVLKTIILTPLLLQSISHPGPQSPSPPPLPPVKPTPLQATNCLVDFVLKTDRQTDLGIEASSRSLKN